ncbi:hypothetical protein LARI1_G008601 [Lachnellula arida]|uniref:Uncharacterized protein n=1 Tax=Lachnellula arida TaxID=1316785 RepID=A0A8T9AYX5_9HELO|nr:hypothetical protein LARI1_G008601 [Lachnellula arida]
MDIMTGWYTYVPDHVSTSRRREGKQSALPTDTWVDVQSNAGIGNVDGAAFSGGLVDLISSDSLSWNSPCDAFLLTQVYHFKNRVVLDCYDVGSILPLLVPLDTKTILQKRDFKAGP